MSEMTPLTFYGKEFDYWLNLEKENEILRARHVAEMNAKVEALDWRDKEIYTLRAKLEAYEYACNQLGELPFQRVHEILDNLDEALQKLEE